MIFEFFERNKKCKKWQPANSKAVFGMCVGTTRAFECIQVQCASLCGRNPLRVVRIVSGHCDRAARAASGVSSKTATPEHVMEHAWADRPKLHSGIDVQHAITGHTTPANDISISRIYTVQSVSNERMVECHRSRKPRLDHDDKTSRKFSYLDVLKIDAFFGSIPMSVQQSADR